MNLGNLSGTLYKGDIPVLSFIYTNGELTKLRLLTANRCLLPIELWNGITEYALNTFFELRLLHRYKGKNYENHIRRYGIGVTQDGFSVECRVEPLVRIVATTVNYC